MSKGVLMIDKKEIPIIQVGVNKRVRNVTAADHFVIPIFGKTNGSENNLLIGAAARGL